MRDLFFSLMHGLGVANILRKYRIKNREISILLFHRISDESDPLWPPLPIRTFRLLMEEVYKKACIIPLENIENVTQYPDKPLVALSFDDGYEDFWENAVPILADFKLPAHHNICPNIIDSGIPPWPQVVNKFLQCSVDKTIKLPDGKIYRKTGKMFNEADFINICNELYEIDDSLRGHWIYSLVCQIPKSKFERLMTWNQLKECVKLGIHIGSHGINHLNMSKIKNQDVLLAEIKDSKKRIFDAIGIEPLIFAFPNGLYNSLAMDMVKENGYKIALLCGDKAAFFTKTASYRDNFHIFSRINISRANWKEENLRSLGLHQKLKRWLPG